MRKLLPDPEHTAIMLTLGAVMVYLWVAVVVGTITIWRWLT